MKNLIALAAFMLAGYAAKSQTGDDKDAIMIPVHQLFEAMSKGDSAMLHRAFADHSSLYSIMTNKSGKTVLQSEPLSKFLTDIGTPHRESYDEPIWDIVIQVDGGLAQVWAKYAFYLDRKFSHCGVDTFQLINTETGWKIFHLADTRQREGCHVPEEVSSRYAK
jgi:Putative lumazine-binding